MRFVVRNRRDRRLRLLGEARDQFGRRSDAVADDQDHRAGLEAAHRFLDRADRKYADAIEAQPLERILQRLRDPLHHDDDRRRARGRGAAHLIFDQGSAGERQQRAQAAFIVLLISSDQSADRQFASPRPRIQAILSNRFHASSKMVNCPLP